MSTIVMLPAFMMDSFNQMLAHLSSSRVGSGCYQEQEVCPGVQNRPCVLCALPPWHTVFGVDWIHCRLVELEVNVKLVR